MSFDIRFIRRPKSVEAEVQDRSPLHTYSAPGPSLLSTASPSTPFTGPGHHLLCRSSLSIHPSQHTEPRPNPHPSSSDTAQPRSPSPPTLISLLPPLPRAQPILIQPLLLDPPQPQPSSSTLSPTSSPERWVSAAIIIHFLLLDQIAAKNPISASSTSSASSTAAEMAGKSEIIRKAKELEVTAAPMAEDQDQDSAVLEEEYAVWKKNSPFLYDLIISHPLEWPSLTVHWAPSAPQPHIDPSFAVHKLAEISLPTDASLPPDSPYSFQFSNGLKLHGKNVLLRYMGRIAKLYGENAFEAGKVDEWLEYAPVLSQGSAFESACKHLDEYLGGNTFFFFANQSLSIADIAIWSGLAGTGKRWESLRNSKKYPNLSRWFNSLLAGSGDAFAKKCSRRTK